MATVSRALLYGVGVSAVLIATSIIMLGPEPTLGAFARAYEALIGLDRQLNPEWAPSMDSELRFYASMWLVTACCSFWQLTSLPNVWPGSPGSPGSSSSAE